MTRSCDRLSWIGSWKKPDDSPPSARSDLLSLYLHLSLTLSVLTEANPRQSFTSSVAETEKTKEEECGGENIGATVPVPTVRKKCFSSIKGGVFNLKFEVI
ncbi:hypothetical protein Bca4012_075832 [Brassica carinata]